MTLRALDILAQADRIYAEDTRITTRLLTAYGITTPMAPYHDHNGEKVRPRILAELDAGKVLALVSDAGTPLVSDPGHKLVEAVLACGHEVIPVPGASAALSALVVSGLPADRFLFAGFPPHKSEARRQWLSELATEDATLILYESARRAAGTLGQMHELFGDRPAVLARELTKRFETVWRGSLAALTARAQSEEIRGEVVLLVGPPLEADRQWDDARLDAALREALTDLPVSRAARDVARQSGRSRQEVYDRALALRQSEP